MPTLMEVQTATNAMNTLSVSGELIQNLANEGGASDDAVPRSSSDKESSDKENAGAQNENYMDAKDTSGSVRPTPHYTLSPKQHSRRSDNKARSPRNQSPRTPRNRNNRRSRRRTGRGDRAQHTQRMGSPQHYQEDRERGQEFADAFSQPRDAQIVRTPVRPNTRAPRSPEESPRRRDNRRDQLDNMLQQEAGSRNKILCVGRESGVKQVAEAIVSICRKGECPTIKATFPIPVNQAIKGIAVARRFLASDGMDLNIYPVFTEQRRQGASGFEFHLRKAVQLLAQRSDETEHMDEKDELKIAKKSNAGRVAGAISAKIRGGIRVVLTAIGPDAVSAAVSAMVISRKYLSQDGVDISFRPQFHELQYTADNNDNRVMNSIQFKLYAQQI